MPLLSTFGAASVKGFGGGLFQSSADVAEAVEFVANSSGYISRTSNLSGISDGKNVLFSGWLYRGRVATDTWFFIATSTGSNRVYISADDSDKLYCYFMTSGGTENVVVIESRRTSGAGIPTGAWTHVMFSFNAANSSQRHVYINGEVPAHLSYSSYNNLDIGMANPRFALSGDISETDQYSAKRLAHVFFDDSYLDLSQSSNRAKFITTDGFPASGQSALSPKVYLPLKAADTAGDNLGTGGAFTANQPLATAERGPNQYNSYASLFGDSSRALTRVNSSDSASSKTITLSCIIKGHTNSTAHIFNSSGPGGAYWYFDLMADRLEISAYAGGSYKLRWKYYTPTNFDSHSAIREYSIQISVNLANSSQQHFIVNGETNTTLTEAYVDTTFDWTAGGKFCIAADHYSGSTSIQSDDLTVGDFYFDTTYTDLGSNNPFWDSDNNKSVSMKKVIADTGTTPKIALPLHPANPSINDGSFGGFTMSGATRGGYGGSEHQVRSASFNGTSAYLKRGDSAFTLTDSSSFTFACAFKPYNGYQEQQTLFHCETEVGGATRFWVKFNSSSYLGGSGRIEVNGYDSSGVNKLELVTGSNYSYSADIWYTILCSSNGSTARLYVNAGNQNYPVAASLATNYVQNATIKFNTDICSVGARYRGSGETTTKKAKGDIASVYMRTGVYTDFSQSSNIQKFLTPMGQFRNLKQQIDDGNLSNGMVLLEFNDFNIHNYSGLGKNTGATGDFDRNAARPGDDLDRLFQQIT